MEKGGVEVLELSNAATMHLAFPVIGARGLSTYGRVFNAFIVSNRCLFPTTSLHSVPRPTSKLKLSYHHERTGSRWQANSTSRSEWVRNLGVHKFRDQLKLSRGFRSILAKLLIFSITLAVAPLSSYFLSEKYLWNGMLHTPPLTLGRYLTLRVLGNSTFAAITAIVAANIVLVVYIIMSVLEEKAATSTQPSSETETKKTQ